MKQNILCKAIEEVKKDEGWVLLNDNFADLNGEIDQDTYFRIVNGETVAFFCSLGGKEIVTYSIKGVEQLVSVSPDGQKRVTFTFDFKEEV